jgi:hypothetical protein
MRPNRRETISLLASVAPAAVVVFSNAGMTNPSQAQGVKSTGPSPLQKIETRIGTLEFTHDFANGYPTDATVEKLYDERDFQRACQAYLWSLPAVSFASWQRGITQQLGARNGQIVAILSLEARRGILTANATTPYYLGFADLSAGPLIMVIPPRGVQGGISDAWQRTIPGTETPGTYLVLAPGTSDENSDRSRVGWRGHGEGQLGGSPVRGREISARRALGLRVATGCRRSRCILEPAR